MNPSDYGCPFLPIFRPTNGSRPLPCRSERGDIAQVRPSRSNSAPPRGKPHANLDAPPAKLLLKIPYLKRFLVGATNHQAPVFNRRGGSAPADDAPAPSFFIRLGALVKLIPADITHARRHAHAGRRGQRGKPAGIVRSWPKHEPEENHHQPSSADKGPFPKVFHIHASRPHSPAGESRNPEAAHAGTGAPEVFK